MNSHLHNLGLLRDAMKKNGVDSYIIPMSDPHLGENIPDHWKIIRWLTGFDGSAGTVIVTDSFAGVWTDSRYYLQADKQLAGSGFSLMKSKLDSDYTDWIAETTGSQEKIGLDGRIFSISQVRKLESKVAGKNIIIDTNADLVGEIWNDRPPLPFSVGFDHPAEYSGKDRLRKLKEVREEMKKVKASCHLITACDDIMWLLNIRGKDLPFSPLLISYSLITEDQLFLFIDDNKIPPDLSSEFDRSGIVILPYEECSSVFSSLDYGSTILLNPATTSASLWNSIPGFLKIAEDISIPARMKAIKNLTEIENIGRTMIRDGVALTRFFHWIESSFQQVPLTEVFLSGKLSKLRSQQDEYLGPSFAPIVAFNEHAALPHYVAATETDFLIEGSGILLVDSGGQYKGGTTDITRTISIGIPTRQQRTDFTLILKGHISLASARFPLGTRGYQLDILARKPLWERGLNYSHGTGHGVGYCLNVHEGPQSINPADNKTIIVPGMLISNEPAVYREGEYGMRTENLILCYEDEETDFGQFLKFDTVSLCYIDRSLIDVSLLKAEEIEWINKYHSEVYEKISPFLSDDEKQWLKVKTEPLQGILI